MSGFDLTGQRFGRLTVKADLGTRKTSAQFVRYWACDCDCGQTVEVRTGGLRSGATKSCGCLHKEIMSQSHYRHGMIRSTEYRIWNNIKNRCGNPNVPAYPRYGGRGITICDRWKDDFSAFLSDMGPRPSTGHSIDRINNDGNYEPGNCRWATAKEQGNNSRHNRIVSVRGEEMTLSQAVERFGGNYDSVKWRIYQGQTAEQALKLEPTR
jgi:hypothetical protein